MPKFCEVSKQTLSTVRLAQWTTISTILYIYTVWTNDELVHVKHVISHVVMRSLSYFSRGHEVTLLFLTWS